MRIGSLLTILAYALMLVHGIGHAELEVCHDACDTETPAAFETEAPQFTAPGCDAACCESHSCEHAHYHASSAALTAKTQHRPDAAPTAIVTVPRASAHSEKFLQAITLIPKTGAPTYLRNLSIRI